MLKSFYSKATSGDLPLLPLHNSATSPSSPPASRFSDVPPPSSDKPSHVPQSPSLLAISRQSNHLQSHLQTLLDAQSAGLLSEFGANPPDDTTSVSSGTTRSASFSASTSQFFSKPSPVVPVRQPKPKLIGLRSARRGITQTIRHLAELKSSEAGLLEEEILRREGVISDVDGLAQKSQDLQGQIEAIESESSNDRIHGLKEEEFSLGTEIRELETRLFEMKARQRHLLREISALESGVKSKLSSYRSALKLAEQESKEYLAHPPLDVLGQERRGDGVWALPPARRTLDLAKEQWVEEQKTLDGKRGSVLVEKEALEQGGRMWEDAVEEIVAVEDALRREMLNIKGEQGIQSILERISQAAKKLEGFLTRAETNDWKLLIVAIGAELEALVNGGRVLENALGVTHVDKRKGETATDGEDRESPFVNGDSLDQEEEEEEDDGPGADLLISPQDS